MNYKTIKVEVKGNSCFIQFNRPESNNTINKVLIDECNEVLDMCEEAITIVVFKGLPEVFCFGADFKEVHNKMADGQEQESYSEPLYDLWLKIATGPYITIALVCGKANAGGVGFVAACDIVLTDDTAVFSLSELLFGLFPACVLPFLIRRIGYSKAHYMTLMTKPVSVEQAYKWGLVDSYGTNGDAQLGKHMLRLRYLSKKGVKRYKSYMSNLSDFLIRSKDTALTANLEIFSDTDNLKGIYRFVDTGQFPWEN